MGLIHLKCLRSWLETKRTKKTHESQVTLKFSKLDCELCNQNFPFKIAYKNQIVDIVGVEKPQKDFIVLESLSNENAKVFHIINTARLNKDSASGKNMIKIGRGLDFYQKPDLWFGVGSHDLSMRRCLETKIDIFRS